MDPLLRFSHLVFLSFPVFLLFFLHLSISPRYDSWDMSRSCVVVTLLLEDRRCYVVVGIIVEFKDFYKPARGITVRKRYVSVLLFCLLKLYCIRFAFHRLFRLLASFSRDHVLRLGALQRGKS